MGDYERWRLFCLGEKEEITGKANEIGEERNSGRAFRSGHLPTPAIVMNLSENQVNSLIQHLVQVRWCSQDMFLEDGYSKQLFQWLYSVLLVVEKPLLHDVCASLRAFAKQCRLLRATPADDSSGLAVGDVPTPNEFSLFIALISIYFEQKDLADHQ
ncbi:unnamed protein product [Toxocara canis]|uniref:Gem-associated protein 2 n=1 Tax=Toxocara canis TaxID=6265 RepID=A0A183TYK6_TOXCA|nr:unnamed protein product [Toxocara canis]